MIWVYKENEDFQDWYNKSFLNTRMKDAVIRMWEMVGEKTEIFNKVPNLYVDLPRVSPMGFWRLNISYGSRGTCLNSRDIIKSCLFKGKYILDVQGLGRVLIYAHVSGELTFMLDLDIKSRIT